MGIPVDHIGQHTGLLVVHVKAIGEVGKAGRGQDILRRDLVGVGRERSGVAVGVAVAGER